MQQLLKRPVISVVVATRDRPEMLRACVKTLLGSKHASFEVVVVDQSRYPSNLPEDPRIIYVHSDTHGKSAGLNAALTVASGSIIAFTDDDCTIPDDWLSKACTLFARHPDVDLAFGNLEAVEHDPAENFVPIVSIVQFRVVSKPRLAYVRGGAGANMIARRSLFDHIGPYDEMIGPGSRFVACEEYDIYFRTLMAGRSVAFAPELVITHWGTRSYSDGSGRRLLRGYAYGEGAVIGKHLRLRETSMVAVAAHIALQDVGGAVRSLVHGRLAGLGSMACKWRGVIAGLSTPVDRSGHVFRTCNPPATQRAPEPRLHDSPV